MSKIGKRQHIMLWDLDWYFAKDKTNLMNPDLMQLASYYQQLGDEVLFVENKYDINRPCDIYYFFKRNKLTPNPPVTLLVDNNVKLIGKGFAPAERSYLTAPQRGCRPDYTIYPVNIGRSTKIERSAYIRLLDSKGNLLPLYQNPYRQTKDKYLIVSDDNLWYSDEKTIVAALDRLKENEKVGFLEPIWTEKLISNQIIREKFLSLKFARDDLVRWTNIKLDQLDATFDLFKQFKALNPKVKFGRVHMNISDDIEQHWENKDAALLDYKNLRKAIIAANEVGIELVIDPLENNLDTPYYQLFNEISNWTAFGMHHSWLEYITWRYAYNMDYNIDKMVLYWRAPRQWHSVYRDLIRQTMIDREFCCTTLGLHLDPLRVPWDLWEQEFKYGI